MVDWTTFTTTAYDPTQYATTTTTIANDPEGNNYNYYKVYYNVQWNDPAGWLKPNIEAKEDPQPEEPGKPVDLDEELELD